MLFVSRSDCAARVAQLIIAHIAYSRRALGFDDDDDDDVLCAGRLTIYSCICGRYGIGKGLQSINPQL